ncbi:MAG: nucleotidyltransferase domain-containing protein [Bacteroidales bacterium]|nr:nucleotidyltransferase domain-containing protein [Bacteroidales bacterium]
MFGLKDADIEAICVILATHQEVDEAIIFGSRAKGNFKNGSDVDIALKGNTITFSTINAISFELNEESLMPYKFDILNYHTIKNSDLKEHIDRIGVSFYKKSPELSLRGFYCD